MTDAHQFKDARIVFLPADNGRKSLHVAVMETRGGGWWDIACMGQAKRCKAGECKHTANLRQPNGRRVRQVAP